MWVIPLLLLGAVFAAVSRSPRTPAPPQRQLPPPGVAGVPPGVPGPISVLGAFLRRGMRPPQQVVLCAMAEAQHLGRHDLVSDIARTFGAFFTSDNVSSGPQAPMPPMPPMPGIPMSAPSEGTRIAPPSEALQETKSAPMEDDICAMLHTDPKAFMEMVAAQSQRRGPKVEIFPLGTSPSSPAPSAPPPFQSPAAAPVESTGPSETEILVGQLSQMPGYMGAGVTGVDPSTGMEVLEVRWLRGYEIPVLPQMLEGRLMQIVLVDNDPASQMVVAPEVSVQEPGSPISGVPDEAWRHFVGLLARESPVFSSLRHVGQYRQRRERLAEFGLDPQTLIGSPSAQRQALDIDLVDAHRHAVAGGLVEEHLGRPIAIPGYEGAVLITLSGMLGVIQCAGLDGAVGWLENLGDRKRFPHTTQAFLRTNGVF